MSTRTRDLSPPAYSPEYDVPLDRPRRRHWHARKSIVSTAALVSAVGAILLPWRSLGAALGFRTSTTSDAIAAVSTRIDSTDARVNRLIASDSVRGADIRDLQESQRFSSYALCVLIRERNPRAECPPAAQAYPARPR